MPDPLSCLIVADDLTGACDTGLQLVQAGLRTHVVHGLPLPQETEVLVWNTGTRNAAAAEARHPPGSPPGRSATGTDSKRDTPQVTERKRS